MNSSSDLDFLLPELRSHVAQYFERNDYYQAVTEAFKLVRLRLEELTGNESASRVFGENTLNEQYWGKIYGCSPNNQREIDYRRAVGYLHLAIQYFRNELVHQVADERFDRNLALSYVATANLALHCIGPGLPEEWFDLFNTELKAVHGAYRARRWFYSDLASGGWMSKLSEGFQADALVPSQLQRLKEAVLADLELQHSYDRSNIEFMKLEFVAGQLSDEDIDVIITAAESNPNNDQSVGFEEFLRYCKQKYPTLASDQVENALSRRAVAE
ncbi:TIGR02391 family protein [Corynebacterium sp. NML140438]|uniref:TIGR02391 family protein n=1 Tax=Corynebacterium sp. NML140438 TaxID=1906334 RepID=UPI0008FB7815|nr:TIGR02391 family protein [Corynebacterium sp. NML140438]OIR44892.1 TIGR02391 family protein [Corynebacterium sp. NML140438]